MKPNQLLAVVCLLLACFLVAVDQGWIDRDVLPVPPQPRPEVVWAVVIEESADRTPELAAVLYSPEVRGLFPEFRLVDKDDAVEPALEALKQRGIARGLPALFIIDPAGKVWHEGDVPLSIEQWRSVIEEVKQ